MGLQSERLEAVCGQAFTTTIMLRTNSGAAVTTWTSSATLTLSAWQGSTYAAAFTPTGAWVSAPAGTLTISIASGDTTAVAPGRYLIRLSVDGGPAQPVATIRLTPTKGVTALPRMYCDLVDLENECSFIESLECLNNSRALNFIPERAQASRKAEEIATGRYLRVLRDQARRHGPVLSVTAIVPTTGYDAGPEWGDSAIPDTTMQTAKKTFADAVVSVGLMTSYSVDFDALRKWAALYALYLALDDQVGTVGDSDTSIQSLAMKYLKRANMAMVGLTLRVDSDADGTPDYELVS
jgi:hypothetical protein